MAARSAAPAASGHRAGTGSTSSAKRASPRRRSRPGLKPSSPISRAPGLRDCLHPAHPRRRQGRLAAGLAQRRNRGGALHPGRQGRLRRTLGRPLKIAELARLLLEAPDHLRLMLMILIGTACRPEAALELTGAQLDFDDLLIDLNPRGRKQTKKFRPVVKMPDTLATVLTNAPSGRLVTFRGQPVKKINKAWRGMRRSGRAGRGGQSLFDPPHRGPLDAPEWRAGVGSGGAAWPQVTRLSHDRALCGVRSGLSEQRRSRHRLVCSRHFAPVSRQWTNPFFRAVHRQDIDFDEKFGAGEGIRTLDPNLGKVVLYP